MRRRAGAVVVLVAVLALGAFLLRPRNDAPIAAPATTTAAPEATTTTTGPPSTTPPDRWMVEVAVATPAVLEVWRDPPPEEPAAADESVTTLEATTTTAAPTTTTTIGGTTTAMTTTDDVARAAAFALLAQDAHAVEVVAPDDEPPTAVAMSTRRVGLTPEAEALIALGSMERTTERGPLSGPAPALPRERALTTIPSPGLSWGADATDSGWTFTNPTPSGNARVFLVTTRRDGWVKVVLPTRPNQQEGWVRRADVVLSRHQWHVEVDVSDNLLRVWNGDDLEIETLVVDGRASTPTPLGRFYLNERVAQTPGSFYAPWILSTNGFSDTLERFSGEVPIFALHGGGYANTIGSSISNGCIRIPPEVVARMGELLPMGTPVDVHA